MEYYQHEFDRIEDYLHHRPPYLLVQRIDSIGEVEVVTRMTVSGDEFFLQGHFPGAPILPGAMMQELTTQSAGILIAAKYNPLRAYHTSDPFFNEYALGVLVKVTHAALQGLCPPWRRADRARRLARASCQRIRILRDRNRGRQNNHAECIPTCQHQVDRAAGCRIEDTTLSMAATACTSSSAACLRPATRWRWSAVSGASLGAWPRRAIRCSRGGNPV